MNSTFIVVFVVLLNFHQNMCHPIFTDQFEVQAFESQTTYHQPLSAFLTTTAKPLNMIYLRYSNSSRTMLAQVKQIPRTLITPEETESYFPRYVSRSNAISIPPVPAVERETYESTTGVWMPETTIIPFRDLQDGLIPNTNEIRPKLLPADRFFVATTIKPFSLRTTEVLTTFTQRQDIPTVTLNLDLSQPPFQTPTNSFAPQQVYPQPSQEVNSDNRSFRKSEENGGLFSGSSGLIGLAGGAIGAAGGAIGAAAGGIGASGGAIGAVGAGVGAVGGATGAASGGVGTAGSTVGATSKMMAEKTGAEFGKRGSAVADSTDDLAERFDLENVDESPKKEKLSNDEDERNDSKSPTIETSTTKFAKIAKTTTSGPPVEHEETTTTGLPGKSETTRTESPKENEETTTTGLSGEDGTTRTESLKKDDTSTTESPWKDDETSTTESPVKDETSTTESPVKDEETSTTESPVTDETSTTEHSVKDETTTTKPPQKGKETTTKEPREKYETSRRPKSKDKTNKSRFFKKAKKYMKSFWKGVKGFIKRLWDFFLMLHWFVKALVGLVLNCFTVSLTCCCKMYKCYTYCCNSRTNRCSHRRHM